MSKLAENGCESPNTFSEHFRFHTLHGYWFLSSPGRSHIHKFTQLGIAGKAADLIELSEKHSLS